MRKRRKRIAELTCTYGGRVDMPTMLSRRASLNGSSHRRAALARALFVIALALGWSLGSATQTTQVEYYAAEAGSFNPLDIMNLKLYLHNTINDWDQFVCANELAHRESTWRYDAVNIRSGAYGLFQHMSNHAKNWDAYQQINKHVEYINKRYNGSWCKALSKLEREGWH